MGFKTRYFQHCSKLKALGPNEFPAYFYHAYWYIISLNVVDAISWVFQNSEMSSDWKATAVTFIHKVSYLHKLETVWSVSLCCTFYKVVARILVESQRCDCIVHLASPEQATFAPDRSILNIIPYVQELTTLTKWPQKRVVLYGRAWYVACLL